MCAIAPTVAWLSTPVASASGAGALAPISTVAQAGVALHIPRDGRLNGDRFSMDITGYRFAFQVGTGGSVQDATSGQVLLVFGLRGFTSSANAELVVDGQVEALPASANGSSPLTYYVAPMPDTVKHVALQVSAAGFVQTFSFSAGHRVGLQPQVLYAQQSGWQEVDTVDQGTTVQTPDTLNAVAGAVRIYIGSVALTYFLPGSGQTPAGPAKAWLVLRGSAMPLRSTTGVNANSNEDYQKTLPPSDFTLALPGGKVEPAMLSGQGGTDDESGDSGGWGLFGGDYFWRVPATTRSATLRLHLPAELAAAAGYFGDHWGALTEVPVHGAVPPLHLSFPPPYVAPAVQGVDPPAWAPKPAGTSTSVAAEVIGSALGIGAFVLVVAGGAFLVLRRAVPALKRASAPVSPRTPPGQAVPAWFPTPAPAGPHPAPPPNAPVPQPPGPTAMAPPAEAPAAAHERGQAPSPEPSAGAGAGATPLVAVPQGPPPLPEGALELCYLGPVEVVGLREGARLGPPELETLLFMAERPEECSSGESLRSGMDVGRTTERTPETVRNYINDIRKVIGADRLPVAKKSGGYRLVGVSTDAGRFRALVAKASAEPANAERHLADALSLVRGAPFAATAAGTYVWAFQGTTVSSLSNSVHTAAVRLAQLALTKANTALATYAVGKGLLVWPTDVTLRKLELGIAASVDKSSLSRTWASISQQFVAHKEALPEELISYYNKLRGEGA